jgi:MFS transporter, CP family, cyanate transporter
MAAFSHTPSEVLQSKGNSGAAWVVVCGVAAALHVGKLPAMLPLVADEMHLSRIETGWLLAVFQIAGMLLGVMGGLLSDKIGRRRLMLTGLVLLGTSSIAAGLIVQRGSPYSLILLLVFRAIESFAFIFTVLPGPGLLQGLVPALSLRRYMGWWSAYMPAGMALGLLAAPLLSEAIGWRGVWIMLGVVNLLLFFVVVQKVPRDAKAARGSTQNLSFASILLATLGARGPWLLALLFLCYAAQWSGLFGFLPTIYQEQGMSAIAIGWLTAFAVFANVVGNIAAGSSKFRADPWLVVSIAACVMSLCSAVVLGTMQQFFGIEFSFATRFSAIVLFSLIGGFIPSTIFGLVASLAPALKNGEKAVGTTAGMFQQGSAFGQVMTPPLIAWTVQRSGDWANAWWVMAALTAGCLIAALGLRSELAAKRSIGMSS